MSSVNVGSIVAEAGRSLPLDVLVEGDLKRLVESTGLVRPGLLLTGYEEMFPQGHIQVLGALEHSYLSSLDERGRKKALARLFGSCVPLIILTANQKPFSEVLALARETDTTLLSTPSTTAEVTLVVGDLLASRMAPWVTVHGTLVAVHGAGLLITGKSNTGKSECALDLVRRGHRLVADDLVRIRRYPPNRLTGDSPALEGMRYYMEVKGYGFVNLLDLFGVGAVEDSAPVSVEVELVLEEQAPSDSFDVDTKDYLGIDVPHVSYHQAPGKDISTIVETVALNTIALAHGKDAGKRLSDTLREQLLKKGG